MRVVMHHKKTDQPTFRKRIALSDIEINKTTLKECLCYMAYMVNEHGDTYLPIFERLKEELEILKQREALKNYARKIANENIKL